MTSMAKRSALSTTKTSPPLLCVDGPEQDKDDEGQADEEMEGEPQQATLVSDEHEEKDCMTLDEFFDYFHL